MQSTKTENQKKILIKKKDSNHLDPFFLGKHTENMIGRLFDYTTSRKKNHSHFFNQVAKILTRNKL